MQQRLQVRRGPCVEAEDNKQGEAEAETEDSPDADDLIRVVDMQTDPRYLTYAEELHKLMARKGMPPGKSRYMMRTNTTVAAAMMVTRGDADALISGVAGGGQGLGFRV
jgi:phosphotransacetylase